MIQEFAIRCAGTDPEFPPALIRDGSGEVLCFPSMDVAVANAIHLQDRTQSDVFYTVEPI